MMLRRRLMLGLGAMAGAGTAAAWAPDQTALRRFVKLRGALDDRLVIGCVSGRYDGVVEGVVTPLFGVVSAVFARYRPRGGGFDVASFEQAYFTDLASGKALEHWKNPYTGEVVAVPVYSRPPVRLFLGPDLVFRSPAPAPKGVHVHQSARGPEMIGEDIVFVEQVDVSLDGSPGQLPFAYRDNTVLRAKLREVDRPDTQATPCETTFEATVSWRPWLKMGARPGHMEALGYGGFGGTMASLPPAWVQATARVNPGLLDHPEQAVAPAWHTG